MSEAALLEEISRLQNAITRQKQTPSYRPPPQPRTFPQPGAYRQPPKDVIINGVTFQSSGKSLVRKAAPTSNICSAPPPPPASSSSLNKTITPVASTSTTSEPMIRTKKGTLIAAHRVHKPRSTPKASAIPPKIMGSRRPPFRSSARAGRGGRRANMTLNNTTRPRRKSVGGKRAVIDKPCRHFTTRGVCNNGLKCRYKHNPDKVAICPRFLSDECPLSAETCPLSHDPTPERVPICVHFANNGGRCRNGSACKYPHVRLGPKQGVCRDFAVLGYCEKGLDCEHNHVRECPDFADSGRCTMKGCKLPHVIRAKHKQPLAPSSTAANVPDTTVDAAHVEDDGPPPGTFENNGEYISLTFEESSEEDEHEEDGDDDDDDDDDEEGEEGEEGEDEDQEMHVDSEVEVMDEAED